ncbi:hypothetical protein LZ554_001849 [Drepanopeziza brunnea f. sp. 'monogermtubi']|nr:hypothetical protein LZ554_001849 [Drepanopeziza brunnea f. sp. 'monogermtubi']
MFNVCRRGPASISRVFRVAASTTRTPSSKPLTLSLCLQPAARIPTAARWISVSSHLRNYAAAEREMADGENHVASGTPSGPPPPQKDVTTFQELIDNDMVHRNVVEAITKGMGHQNMTEVQAMTINQGLSGSDIVAQARTGTGKTLGFLVPTIQNILRQSPELATRKRYSKARASDIRAIIISPTRELAEQIAVEAEKLCGNTDLRVQVAVGGNSKRSMLQKTLREGCHLLVGTPGRLQDLLEDNYSGVKAPNLTTLVLDEADRLLDDGFSKDIRMIQDLLPDRKVVDRQTLLFSATMPREVMHLVRSTLKPGFHFVQAVKEGDLATHEKVPQHIVITPGIENHMPALLELAKREIEKAARAHTAGEEVRPFKAIVYFQSTANVILASDIFQNLKSTNSPGQGMFGKHPLYPAQISEMHGQLSQQARTYVSERFRRAKSAILFSTDVTARGMDFPNVTHVVQIGLPPNREQYIHRIGRTGRGDKTGDGLIFLNEASVQAARKMLRGLPIIPDKSLQSAEIDMTKDAQVPQSIAETLSQVGDAIKMVSRRTKEDAYMGALGSLGGVNPIEGAMALNRWTRYGWGFEEPPRVAPDRQMTSVIMIADLVDKEEDTEVVVAGGDEALGVGTMVVTDTEAAPQTVEVVADRLVDLATVKGELMDLATGEDGVVDLVGVQEGVVTVVVAVATKAREPLSKGNEGRVTRLVYKLDGPSTVDEDGGPCCAIPTLFIESISSVRCSVKERNGQADTGNSASMYE